MKRQAPREEHMAAHQLNQRSPERERIEAARYRAQLNNFAYQNLTAQHHERRQRAFKNFEIQVQRYLATREGGEA